MLKLPLIPLLNLPTHFNDVYTNQIPQCIIYKQDQPCNLILSFQQIHVGLAEGKLISTNSLVNKSALFFVFIFCELLFEPQVP
jgi:hypothetical protein